MKMFIIENKVSFLPAIQRGQRYQYFPLDSLYCHYGLFIPLNPCGFNVYDFWETGKWDKTVKDVGVMGVIFTHDGKMYEVVSVTETNGFIFYKRIPLSPNLKYSRCGCNFSIEQKLAGILETTNKHTQVLKVINKAGCIVSDQWVTLSLDAITTELKRRNLTTPIPPLP